MLVPGLLVAISEAAASAASCSLSVPAQVKVGAAFTIVGTGFPVGSRIDMTFARDGAGPTSFSFQNTSAAGFQFELTAESEDIGETKVLASVSGGCTATASYTVV